MVPALSALAPDPGASVPFYPIRHVGPCIVAGAAWCLHDDLVRAWALYPDAPVLAVNGAAREVKAIGLVSQHPDRFASLGWRRNQARLYGGCPTHSTAQPADYVWGLRHAGGSAWLARKIAALIGFGPVILAGCPMVAGSYAGGKLAGLMHRGDVVDELFAQIERDTRWHEGCLSMSGRTADLLGVS